MNQLLRHWLDRVYQAEIIRPSKDDTPRRLFREALQADDGLRAAAKQRLTELPESITRRDFVMARHKDFLTAALAETENAS